MVPQIFPVTTLKSTIRPKMKGETSSANKSDSYLKLGNRYIKIWAADEALLLPVILILKSKS